MKTRKMTRVQLREAIAEKRGWTRRKDLAWTDADGNYQVQPPDYLGSMDAAMPLLRELPRARLVYTDEPEQHVTNLVSVVWDGGLIHQEKGNEAEAIACAWWQWQTGEIVELENEL